MVEPWLNPNARPVQREISPGRSVWIVDEILLNPERLIRWAANNKTLWERPTLNAYPGIQMPIPAELIAALDDYFARHIRILFNGRRTLNVFHRLAMMTWPAHQLQPKQWLCHRDRSNLDARSHAIIASVLYLFENRTLGGTLFFRPRITQTDLAQLIGDSIKLDPIGFSKKYGLAPAYPCETNEFFELEAEIPARANRIIFYDGSLFHSASVPDESRLNDDPLTGRLTANGFYTIKKSAV
jgi:hypothetical protein